MKNKYYCGLNTYEEFKSLLKHEYERYCSKNDEYGRDKLIKKWSTLLNSTNNATAMLIEPQELPHKIIENEMFKMKNYNNIPTEDWTKYPETKPKESGYYLTTYEDINLYYKCIYWCNQRQDWISWRSPFRSTPHMFKVGCFVEKTRTDFYCPCIEKVEELYDITTC